jgi:hypothetical protein
MGRPRTARLRRGWPWGIRRGDARRPRCKPSRDHGTMAEALLPVSHNLLICAARLANRHAPPYAPESAVGSGRGSGASAGPASGLSPSPGGSHGHHDPVRCTRPRRAGLHQYRAPGVSRVPGRLQRPDPARSVAIPAIIMPRRRLRIIGGRALPGCLADTPGRVVCSALPGHEQRKAALRITCRDSCGMQ